MNGWGRRARGSWSNSLAATRHRDHLALSSSTAFSHSTHHVRIRREKFWCSTKHGWPLRKKCVFYNIKIILKIIHGRLIANEIIVQSHFCFPILIKSSMLRTLLISLLWLFVAERVWEKGRVWNISTRLDKIVQAFRSPHTFTENHDNNQRRKKEEGECEKTFGKKQNNWIIYLKWMESCYRWHRLHWLETWYLEYASVFISKFIWNVFLTNAFISVLNVILSFSASYGCGVGSPQFECVVSSS